MKITDNDIHDKCLPELLRNVSSRLLFRNLSVQCRLFPTDVNWYIEYLLTLIFKESLCKFVVLIYVTINIKQVTSGITHK